MKKFSLDEWRAYLLAQAKEYRVEIKEKRPAVTISLVDDSPSGRSQAHARIATRAAGANKA